ncbi:MAG: S1 family peptidase [Egibacteraceae bacterium]
MSLLLLMGPFGTPGRAASVPLVSQVRSDLGDVDAIDGLIYELATAQPSRMSVRAWSVRADHIVAYVDSGSVERARADLSAAGVELGMVRFAAPKARMRYVPLVCTRSDCTEEPMRGGLSWYTRQGQCTTGFGATRDGADGFMTAGHCAPTGSRVLVGEPPDGTFYGEVTRSVLSMTVDGSFVERDESYPQESRGFIYVSSSDPEHVISSREPRSGYAEDSRSCMSGHFSGLRCGQITDSSYTDVLNGLRDVVLVDERMCGVPGDSGAPVFDGDSTAMGIFTGALVSVLDPTQQCAEAVYHKLFRIESEIGARIITE